MSDDRSIDSRATTFVVDDEGDIRLMVRLILESSGDYVVVAEATDGEEAVELLHSSAPGTPDIVLLDNRMPNLHGLDAAKAILAETPDRMIVLFSAFVNDEVRAEAEAIGIKACVSKTDMDRLPELLDAIVS